MNIISKNFKSEKTIEELYKIIKLYKSSKENRYYIIHSKVENQIIFGKNHGQIINFLDTIETVFKIYLDENEVFKIDVTYSGYKFYHYIFLLLFLFFVFFWNIFIYLAILGIFGYKFYFCFVLTFLIALYILSKKPIKHLINNEIKYIIRIINMNRKRNKIQNNLNDT